MSSQAQTLDRIAIDAKVEKELLNNFVDALIASHEQLQCTQDVGDWSEILRGQCRQQKWES